MFGQRLQLVAIIRSVITFSKFYLADIFVRDGMYRVPFFNLTHQVRVNCFRIQLQLLTNEQEIINEIFWTEIFEGVIKKKTAVIDNDHFKMGWLHMDE